MAKRMKNWGILSRDVVHSPSFEFLIKAEVLTRKICSTLSQKVRARNTQGNYLFVMKEESMR